MRYLTWNLDLVSNILWMIVALTSIFFPNLLKNWEIGTFEVSLISYLVGFQGQNFRRRMFIDKRWRPNLWLNCQFSRKKKRSNSYNIFDFRLSVWNTVFELIWVEKLRNFCDFTTPDWPPPSPLHPYFRWNKPNQGKFPIIDLCRFLSTLG